MKIKTSDALYLLTMSKNPKTISEDPNRFLGVVKNILLDNLPDKIYEKFPILKQTQDVKSLFKEFLQDFGNRITGKKTFTYEEFKNKVGLLFEGSKDLGFLEFFERTFTTWTDNDLVKIVTGLLIVAVFPDTESQLFVTASNYIDNTIQLI